jgi:hypothetical protein
MCVSGRVGSIAISTEWFHVRPEPKTVDKTAPPLKGLKRVGYLPHVPVDQ